MRNKVPSAKKLLGILREMTGCKRNRLFVFSEYLALLQSCITLGARKIKFFRTSCSNPRN